METTNKPGTITVPKDGIKQGDGQGLSADKLVQQWKEMYGRVFSVEADGFTAYFRKPNRKELRYMLAMQNKPVEATEHLLNSCFLGGDRVFLTDTEYMLGCDKLVEKLVEVKTVELGEL